MGELSVDNLTSLNASGEHDLLRPMIYYHPLWMGFQGVFFIVSGSFGVFGNCLALTALATTPKLRNSCTALIGNLSVADLVSSVQQLFFMVPLMIYKGFPDNMVLCKIAYYIPSTMFAASLTTLVFITFNRYFLITRPRSCYPCCCGNKSVIVNIAIIWIFVFVTMVLPSLNGGSNGVVYSYKNLGCTVISKHIVSIVYLSFFVILPAFVLVPILYGMTVYAAKASHRRVHNGDASNKKTVRTQEGSTTEGSTVSTVSKSVTNDAAPVHHRGVSKRELNLTRIPLLIFTVFACCWTPHLVYVIWDGFTEVSGYFGQLASLFIWANSAINPYLYAWSNRNFRLAYKRLYRKERR
ncbi:protein trapped in endoderm-1-like [Asterias rubens]|uniref:protein trapped in endoderm-1-like n=1 Tax=Asterias rubens TaxID=7604 RepID=UPI0014551D58|nr:protein trapped in endoderm-1-like [Asterias rubens]